MTTGTAQVFKLIEKIDLKLRLTHIIFSMKLSFLTLFTLHLLLTFVSAQEDEPLIPNREDSSSEKPNYIGVKDPFAPATTTAETPAVKATAISIKQQDEGSSHPATQDMPKAKEPSWEEELLNGNDEDFKPAPLKVEDEVNDNQEDSNNAVTPLDESPTNSPTATATAIIITPQNIMDEGEENPLATPTPTSTPRLVVPRQLPKEQIKPADLITEEIDPWDDPRKKVSTTCRLQLERIKKKKKLFERAEATQIRLKESLSTGKGDIEKIKQVSTKLAIKINELKSELNFLKERGVRQGCPGIFF